MNNINNKMRLVFILVLLTIMVLGCSNNRSYVDLTIRDFYHAQCNSYKELEYKDISMYLDMTKIQNQNKVTALKRLIDTRKYIDEKGYEYAEDMRTPLHLKLISITTGGDYSKIVIDVQLDDKIYPPFVSSGENVFELKKYNGKWKITNHDYDNLSIFEISKDKKIPEISYEELKKQIDAKYK